MNSLNILSARVIGPTPPPTPTDSRPRSYSEGNLQKANTHSKPKRSASQHVKREVADQPEAKEKNIDSERVEDTTIGGTSDLVDEKSPLLPKSETSEPRIKTSPRLSKYRVKAKKLVDALTRSLAWVLSTLASPGVYIVAGFYDDRCRFSPLLPVRKLGRILARNQGRSTAQAVGLSGSTNTTETSTSTNTELKNARRKRQTKDTKRKSKGVDTLTATSESEADVGEKVILDTPPEIRPRVQSSSSSDDSPQSRRSVRIKLYNEDATRRRKQRKEKGESPTPSNKNSDQGPSLTVANLKSPKSPISSLKMTKYPRAVAPPRPLIPRRQPSYSSQSTSSSSRLAQKTLVIDLDETLIHSLAKGGRMSSGHMVEVKLNSTVGYGGATLGPQHPILYYVHKRPHCDDFLRKVCKWYNLIVFTASVQEYADPVIDWLEQERTYFSGRYYRQHCTFRNGAYIKDLSSVEPDLSKVMILDNSPLSYIFHEGEASECLLDVPMLIDFRQCHSYRRLD